MSACLFLSAGVLHHCRRSPLLLPGCVRLDVSGGCAAVPHAGRGVWERVLAQEVLLHLWVPHPGCGCGNLSRHRLQRLWHPAGVSVTSLKGFLFCWIKWGTLVFPSPHQHACVLMILISQRVVNLCPLVNAHPVAAVTGCTFLWGCEQSCNLNERAS